MPLLYLRNRSADRGSPNIADAVVPRPLRALIGIGGAVLFVIALVMYVSPSADIDVAPWKLTPLTGRVIAAFLSASGIAALLLSRDRRWSAWQVFVRSAVLASALLLIAAVRAWAEFDSSNALAYGFLAVTGALVIGGVTLDRARQARVRTDASAPAPAGAAQRRSSPRTRSNRSSSPGIVSGCISRP